MRQTITFMNHEAFVRILSILYTIDRKISMYLDISRGTPIPSLSLSPPLSLSLSLSLQNKQVFLKDLLAEDSLGLHSNLIN